MARVSVIQNGEGAATASARATADLVVGLGGTSRNACAAVWAGTRILGVCEQERITRIKAAGVNDTGVPDEALDELLARSGRNRKEVGVYARGDSCHVHEADPLHLNHHFAHACAAFLPTAFESATVIVCDDAPPYVSVWDAEGRVIAPVPWRWVGPGFADLYSSCSEALGFAQSGHEQRMEALARLAPTARDHAVDGLFEFHTEGVNVVPGWKRSIELMREGRAPGPQSAALAAALQRRIADLFLAFVAAVRDRAPARQILCVGGALFSNSYFNARLKSSGLYSRVFVPINPGDAGLAIGAALYAADSARYDATPFLGPAYTAEETKQVLDNCKLSYEWETESGAIDAAVEALCSGRLVGWADGRMEWGTRALGARSILANPFAPYALENLNHFLKRREPWRGYALSGLPDAVQEHFDGPDASPFMECDYRPRDPGRFVHALPSRDAAVRVQTVGEQAPPRFRRLLQEFGAATGVPVLVNTSFNGFLEPIVCSPRDAVRVFFGTGLDLLVLDRFVIRK
jgi:carbamoyltransferase